MVHVWALKVVLVPLLLWIPVLLVALEPALSGRPNPVALAVASGLGAALLVAAYVWASLYHRLYRWDLGEEQLRVWRGILFRRRITVPYMRVQNVNVVRGPLLLLFRLSGVEVETAGQKGWTYSLYPTEGYLPGLPDGETVADLIVDRVRGAQEREGL